MLSSREEDNLPSRQRQRDVERYGQSNPTGQGPFAAGQFASARLRRDGRWASRYLAREFARRGTAGLIYDKRGVGRSTGDWRTAGYADLVGDAAVAAVEALRSRSDISRTGIASAFTVTAWRQHCALGRERARIRVAFVVRHPPPPVFRWQRSRDVQSRKTRWA